MDKKELQRQRMMTYFINAAKEIIETEGVKNLTVRKVGDQAGYSYATIYNYFPDLNTLLYHCVFDFFEDCYQYLIGFKNDDLDCREQVLQYSIAYFRYFAENPGIFKLLFVEDLGEAPEVIVNNNSTPSVALLLNQSLINCAEAGYLSKENIAVLGELIASSIHSKLLFFIGGRHFEELYVEDVIKYIEKEIKFLINYKE